MYKQNKTRSLYFPERVAEAMKSIFDYPLTVIEAPMGYGKTTAVREHLNNTDANILWQRIYDNSKAGFWNKFCSLIGKLNTESSYSLAQMGLPHENISMHEALNLIEEIELQQRTVLVIDDYHLINETDVNNFMEFLISNEIVNFHIVLTTRFSGILNIEELLLKGYLNHITKEVFEFTQMEIVKYYKLCGINLKQVEAEMLFSYSEGWISALYLLMLEFKEEGHFFTTTNIYKLVEKAVYKPFSEDIKDFLVMMSIFDNFTLEQATHMWGNDDAKTFISEITSKNAFVNYDVSSKVYQMHNIFTNFLKDIKKGETIEHEQYKRAGQWFLKIGDYLSAMHYFYSCGDFENLLLALEKDKAASFNSDNKQLLIKYMEECPKNRKAKHLGILLSYAMHLFAFNEKDLFRKVYSEFITIINMDKDLEEDAKKELLGEYEFLLSFTGYNDINKMSEHLKKACKLLTHPTSIYDANNNWIFSSPSMVYLFYRESGKLEQHVNDLIEALPYYYQLTNGHGSGAEYIMEAERYFYMGDLENAEISLYKATHKAQSKNEIRIKLCAEFLQMRISIMKCDYSYIQEILSNIRRDKASNYEYRYRHTLEICEGYIYSLLKQCDKIPERVAKLDLNNTKFMFLAFAMLNIVYGRVLLINGEYLKLMGSSEHFLGIASVFPNLLGQVYSYIYLSAANSQIFREGAAATELLKALDIAMPDKVYMPFVENCDYIKPVLEQLYREDKHRSDISKILELFEIYKRSVEKMSKEIFSAKEKPSLTDREKQIAQLAAEGMTNKEISEKLNISTNTVKTVLKAIFQKLDVNSRVLLKQNI